VTQIPAGCQPKVSWSQGILTTDLHWECQGSPREELIKANLNALIDIMSQMTRMNDFVMLPSVSEYLHEPTPARWKVVVSQVDLLERLIFDTLNNLLKYDASLDGKMEQFPTIAAILGGALVC
jgi:hypothetical protein